jgi:MFS family permease
MAAGRRSADASPVDCWRNPCGDVGRELRLALSGLMLALTLAALDQNIVATALPRITGQFGSLQHLSCVVASFIAASTLSAPLYGKLSDLYGRKPAFIASISIFLAGSALCGFAASMGQLIAFRTVQGLGAGGLIVLAQNGDWRSGFAARARPLSRHVRCSLRGMLGGRTALGRNHHRIRLLALDLLRQSAGRGRPCWRSPWPPLWIIRAAGGRGAAGGPADPVS